MPQTALKYYYKTAVQRPINLPVAFPTQPGLHSREELIVYGKALLSELLTKRGLLPEELNEDEEHSLVWEVLDESAKLAKAMPKELLLATLEDLDDILTLQLFSHKKRSGKILTIPHDEFWAEIERMEQMELRALERCPEGVEQAQILGHRVVLLPLEDGEWLANVPSLTDCRVRDQTKVEAVDNITDAIAEYPEEAIHRLYSTSFTTKKAALLLSRLLSLLGHIL